MILYVISEYIQKQLKRALQRRCRNALSTDWLNTPRKFPLREYYVGLRQSKKIRKARKDIKQELDRIHDVFDIDVEGAVNIALIGKFIKK